MDTLSVSGKVKILWDDGVQETVKFGEDGVYEVHVVNKPKLLEKDEEIAVGVFVARGNERYIDCKTFYTCIF